MAINVLLDTIEVRKDLERLGIDAQIWNIEDDECPSRTTAIVFKNQNDMNLYRMVGLWPESPHLAYIL